MLIGSGVFDPRGSKNRGVPLTRLVALTTVLHYGADCDAYNTLAYKFNSRHFSNLCGAVMHLNMEFC